MKHKDDMKTDRIMKIKDLIKERKASKTRQDADPRLKKYLESEACQVRLSANDTKQKMPVKQKHAQKNKNRRRRSPNRPSDQRRAGSVVNLPRQNRGFSPANHRRRGASLDGRKYSDGRQMPSNCAQRCNRNVTQNLDQFNQTCREATKKMKQQRKQQRKQKRKKERENNTTPEPEQAPAEQEINSVEITEQTMIVHNENDNSPNQNHDESQNKNKKGKHKNKTVNNSKQPEQNRAANTAENDHTNDQQSDQND